MNSQEFKQLFNKYAIINGFEKAYSGWFKESIECIFVLDLQKSNYGDYYELNIKIYIQGLFSKTYVKNKDLVKKDIGDIFTRQPNEFKDLFDFDKQLDDKTRKEKLEKLFEEFIIPFIEKASTKEGIKELEKEGKIFLLPAVKEELENIVEDIN